MADYKKEVQSDAKMEISNYEDEIVELLLAGKDVEGFRDSKVYENIRSYNDKTFTAQDALVVLEESDDVEDDSGLWQGQEPLEAIRSMAHYTYEHDLTAACADLYEEIKEEYDQRINDLGDEREKEGQDREMSEEAQKEIALAVIKEKTDESHDPVQAGSEEEKELLVSWCKKSAEAGMRGGYPLGSSYIDARCGCGLGQPDQLDYINFDHEVAEKVPHLRGKYRSDVLVYLAQTHGVYIEGHRLETTTTFRVDVRTVKAKYESDDKYRRAKYASYDSPKDAMSAATEFVKHQHGKTARCRIVMVETKETVVDFVEKPASTKKAKSAEVAPKPRSK